MKGQITIFIILGIVVLTAFGLTFYAVSKAVKPVERKPAEQVLEQTIVKPVNDYITTCLSLAANEGLELLGKQGGVLYKSEIVTELPAPVEGEYLEYETYKTHYAIVPPEGNVGAVGSEIFFSQPPKYPFPGFPWIADKAEPYFYGYYGISKLPALYKNETIHGSIQEMLEKFVGKKVVYCADWVGFKAQGLSFVTDNPIVSMIVAETAIALGAEQYTSFMLNWTVEVSSPTGEKTTLKEFSVKLPVRLARVYYAIKGLIDADVTDVSFEPKSTDEFEVSKIQSGSDSIVILKDSRSTVAGKPFEFRIARKNRAPALWQVPEKQFDRGWHFGTTFSIKDNTLAVNDPCNSDLVLELNASDPDENTVSFRVDPKEIPDGAFTPFTISISASDGSKEDFQQISLTKVSVCVE